MNNTSKFYTRLNDIQVEIAHHHHTTSQLFMIMRDLIDEAEQSSSRTEKDLIIELAVLKSKYAAVCDELESVPNKLLPAGHQC